MKGQEFSQTRADFVSLGEIGNNGPPEPVLMFESYAMGHTVESLPDASVSIPGGAVVSMRRDFGEDPRNLAAESGAWSLLRLEEQRPDGEYVVHSETQSQGTLHVPLTLAGNAYPPVPQILNFGALQNVAAESDFTLQWSAMNGDALDYIMLQVYDENGVAPGFSSGGPGQPGAMDGTATQIVIPAGTLSPGVKYKAELRFVNTVDIDTSVVPLAAAAYYKMVCFWLNTVPQPGVATGADFNQAIPQDQSMDVPRDSAVSFHFSRPMSPSHMSVGWSSNGGSLNAGSVSYEWTHDNMVLLCSFSQDLPPDANIGWSLNLAGFRDAAGSALSGTRMGTFHTRAEGSSGVPDVAFLSVVKQKHYRQTVPPPATQGVMVAESELSPVPTGMWECDVEMEMSAFNLVKSATLTTPANGSSADLEFSNQDPCIHLDGDFASRMDLERFHTNGTYELTVNTLNDGLKNLSVSLGESDDYPEAPVVTNLAELKGADSGTPVVVRWNTPVGWASGPGVGVVWISLEITNAAGREVAWAEGGELDSSSQFTIPAGTLRPGRDYEISVRFVKITDWDETSYPGAVLAAGFESITTAAMRTAGSPAMPSVVVQQSGVGMQITGNGGESDMGYILEASSDMRHWQQLTQFWVGPGGYGYADSDAQYLKSRFYRLRENPANTELTAYVSIQGTVRSDGVPLAGAVVGTNLDGSTAVTDASGGFFLLTGTKASVRSYPYTIRVNRGGNVQSFGPWVWGDQPRNQVFDLE